MSAQRGGWVKRPGGFREVLGVAYPLVISMGSLTVMQFCDRMFLSWYSAVSIQAALPAGVLSFSFIAGFMALAGYASTFVAQYHGAGDPRGCSRATAQGCWVALFSWPLMLLLLPVGQWLIRASGHAPAVMAEELVYYRILMIGSVASPLDAAISSFFTGRGDTLTNMVAHVAGSATNIVLDYLLIFGRLGFPEMGIAGAAWATVISGFVSPAILFAIYLSRRVGPEYAARGSLGLDRPLMKRLIRFGLPSAMHLVLDVSSFTLFVLFTGRLGSVALAASNIALSVNLVAFMPLIGMSIAASILVGQYQGRGESGFAERSAWTALQIGWIYMVAVGLTFVLFPSAYFSLFGDRGPQSMAVEDLLPVGRVLLLMMAAWGLLDAVNLIVSGALKGAGDTRFVMVYTVIMGWCVWLTGEAVILLVLRRGIVAAWAWLTVYVAIMAIGFLYRFRSGRWKNIDVIERHATPIQPAHPGAEAMTVVD